MGVQDRLTVVRPGKREVVVTLADLRDYESLQELGAIMGSGGLIVMDETTCVVKAALRVVRFFAHESCGQCTPCREGTTWLQQILTRIEAGEGRDIDLDLLLDISDNISPGLAWPPAMTTAVINTPISRRTPMVTRLATYTSAPNCCS